jgi:hypothetical protein
MKKIALMIGSLCLLATIAFAQQPEAYKQHPGYVDFGSFEKFQNAARVVDVSIKGPILKFVSKAAMKNDPELSKLLDNLLLIQVNVFSVQDNEQADVNAIIDNVSNTLAAKQWEQMVRVQENGEHVEVYIQFGEGDALTGLAVMALSEDKEADKPPLPGQSKQAVFVNIVGTIDPEQLGKLSAKFNIPKIDAINFGEKGEKTE